MNEHHLTCDVLVAGGGPAGVACALAAARLGVKVILCQDRPVLGGNASSEIRMHIVGATGLRGGEPLASELREGGIIEELRLDLAVQNPQRSAAMMDVLLYDKCRREPNLTLLLNTTVVAADVFEGMIQSVRAERQSTEDTFRIRAKIFVDCTGDGRLGIEAGAPFMRGREAQSEFAEASAPVTGDKKTLGSTLLFQARKHDRPMPYTAPPWVRRFTAKDFKFRPFAKQGFDLGLEYGYWWIEWGGCLDTIKDNESIRDELLAISLGVWNYIKNESDVDAANWALDWVGFVPGKRESRRFIGQHVLSENDLLTSRAFPDAIAYGGWPIDLHPPEGVDTPEVPPCDQRELPFLYDIPLRSCVSANPGNLMFAGRNISATHVAFASTRVMATCAAAGQGVGTAAALAIKKRVVPSKIIEDKELVTAIRQTLLRDDCYLVGARNEDADDLVRTCATISASSELSDGVAELVRSGQTRSVHGGASGGIRAPADRANPGSHRWMSDPTRGLPAWLELGWERPVTIRELILIFDTGLHRLLTLSQADGYTRIMHWGQPQPETVRDYYIEFKGATGWNRLVEVEDNYQRRRVHRLESAITTNAARITVTATNGLDHARIVEVRAYS